MVTLGIKSFMRFKVLKKVDLPQPDGPINAVTLFEGMLKLIFFRA
jgi:hypothetical protein